MKRKKVQIKFHVHGQEICIDPIYTVKEIPREGQVEKRHSNSYYNYGKVFCGDKKGWGEEREGPGTMA